MKVTVWQRPTKAPGQVTLGYFVEGIRQCGDQVIVRDPLLEHSAQRIKESDIHVVYNPQFNNSNKILSTVKHQGKTPIVIEAGFAGSHRLDPLKGYWLVGFGTGVKNELNFKNQNSQPDRWEKLGLQLQDWQDNEDGHILVTLQMRGDPSLKGVMPEAWARETVAILQQYTDRQIVLRFSPHEKKYFTIDGCLYSYGEKPIQHDLKGAWATVTFSSNSVVESLIAGVPVFANGPSIAGELALNDFTRIEEPIQPDREQWAHNLAYAQWTGEEMRQGLAWKHLMGKANVNTWDISQGFYPRTEEPIELADVEDID